MNFKSYRLEIMSYSIDFQWPKLKDVLPAHIHEKKD
jgi:hypothetical protein